MDNSPSREELAKETSVKILIFAVLTILIFAIILFRAGYLQIVKNTNFTERSKRNRETIVRLPPIRGLIISSDGKILAGNKRVYNIIIEPKLLSKSLEERQKSLVYVSDILGVDYNDIEIMLQKLKHQKLTVAEDIGFIQFSLSENLESMLSFSRGNISSRLSL